jgi:D-inositol-3-phosphate glycosyltransferase
MLLPFADGASTRRTTLQVAWAFGLPVVTTPPIEPTDAILDGENALLAPGDDPEAWASAVGRILTDPFLTGRLRAGSLRAADRFSWERLAAAHLAMYEALLGL